MFNNDRLSFWLGGTLVAWTVCCLCVFLPVGHFLFGASMGKIVVVASIGCLLQLLFTPWLFSARATAENPEGNVVQRSAAVIGWVTLTALLFFYYLQRGWPRDANAQMFRVCLFGTTIVLGVVGLLVVRVVFRRRT
jgi:hypothetical protein